MDDFGGTFFDLPTSSTQYSLCAASTNSNSNGSGSSASALTDLGSNHLLLDQDNDLDELLSAPSFPSLDNSTAVNAQTDYMTDFMNSSSITIKKEVTDTSTLDFMMEQSSSSWLEQSGKEKPQGAMTMPNIKQEVSTNISSIAPTVQPAPFSKYPKVTLPVTSHLRSLSANSKFKTLIPVTVHSTAGFKRTFIQTAIPSSGPLARLVPINNHSLISASSFPVIKLQPREAKALPKISLADPSHLSIVVCNVVASFRVRCHLNLRQIALESVDVVYSRAEQKIVMRLRRPKCTAYMWSSGKVVCTGSNSEENARRAARRYARRLQKVGFKVKFSEFSVVNVLAVSKMPYGINIQDFSRAHQGKYCSYEPELHPGVTFRDKSSKATLKIFSTGSVTVTASSSARAKQGIFNLYPQLKEFYKFDKPNTDLNYDDALPSDNEEEFS